MVIGLCVAELVVVIAFSRSLTRVSSGTALGMFLLYACLTGVSLSSVFLLFDVSGIFLCFLATAASFGAMALYGMRSRKNLAAWGGTLFGALIGLLVLMVASFFLRFPMLDLFICVLGLLVFLGLTAYDTRKPQHDVRSGRRHRAGRPLLHLRRPPALPGLYQHLPLSHPPSGATQTGTESAGDEIRA